MSRKLPTRSPDRRPSSRSKKDRLLGDSRETTASGLSVCSGVGALVGRTPLIELRRIGAGLRCRLWGKAEYLNAGGSVKDRPALAMIEAAEASGALTKGATVVEATSGNTGISLATLARTRGYGCVLVMPEDMSLERRGVLRGLKAQIVLTRAQDGMSGAVERACEIVERTRGAWRASQFDNPNNPRAHELGTGPEILEQVPGSISAFVAGVGTGGTLTGVARALRRELASSVQVVAVEPAGSPVLSGGEPGMHGIQGLGAGFVPENLDRSQIDQVLVVGDLAAERMCQRLAAEEGLFLGPSSGANVHAALAVAEHLPGGHVVTLLCDSGERYLF